MGYKDYKNESEQAYIRVEKVNGVKYLSWCGPSDNRWVALPKDIKDVKLNDENMTFEVDWK